ncbi:uncharacterized protein J3D65DRAFT_622714 [Phyllosticta citribraziliensis]|uniref:Uncharacterized protein n=1 Tax=Phyllosticta citribraziliensis TaxID=989973 RepID=A0ABR1LVZ5_9PEZI
MSRAYVYAQLLFYLQRSWSNVGYIDGEWVANGAGDFYTLNMSRCSKNLRLPRVIIHKTCKAAASKAAHESLSRSMAVKQPKSRSACASCQQPRLPSLQTAGPLLVLEDFHVAWTKQSDGILSVSPHLSATCDNAESPGSTFDTPRGSFTSSDPPLDGY